jgi:hypothetical protein
MLRATEAATSRLTLPDLKVLTQANELGAKTCAIAGAMRDLPIRRREL